MLETIIQQMPSATVARRAGKFDWAVLTLGAVLLSVAVLGALTTDTDRADAPATAQATAAQL